MADTTKSNTTSSTSASSSEEVLAIYKSGGANIRRVISKKDWASLDINLDEKVWEKRNNWTLDATGWPVAAVKFLEADSSFTVERHKS